MACWATASCLNLFIMKSFFVFMFMFSFLGSYAQSKEGNPFSIDNRQGFLFFSVGTDYRITPIEKILESTAYPAGEFRASVDEIGAQNAGIGFHA